jgi:hypothetical protein
MLTRILWILILLFPTGGSLCWAQMQLGQIRQVQPDSTQQGQWRNLALSIAAHGAASGFDAWTSWQRPERNGFLADGGRFAAKSAYTKAGIFAGASILEVIVVKKWGQDHPWLARACQIANFTSSGILLSAGISNLKRR